jgi:hypothetical protein
LLRGLPISFLRRPRFAERPDGGGVSAGKPPMTSLTNRPRNAIDLMAAHDPFGFHALAAPASGFSRFGRALGDVGMNRGRSLAR